MATAFKSITNRELKFRRLVNQAKLRSYRLAPRYKYGYEVPRDYKHAMELDIRNGNKLWREATDLELSQLNEYNTFKDLGAFKPRHLHGYKKIRAHLVYDVKHDGRHKARMVADGHLTTVPVDSVYSGVVSLRGIRMLVFLAELNGLQTWSTDIGNAYLEARDEGEGLLCGWSQSSVILQDIHLLLLRHYMDYGLAEHVGTIGLLIVSATWVLNHQRESLISGCDGMVMSTSI